QTHSVRVQKHRKLGPPDTLPLHPQTAGRNPDIMLIARSKSKSRQSLHLVSSIASDDDGNETSGLTIFEVHNGLITYHGRFDEDDFEGAYRELERRYYAGEGSEFAENGLAVCETALAIARGDHELLSRELLSPTLHWGNRSGSPSPGGSTDALISWFKHLDELVVSSNMWQPAICWLSSGLSVFRLQRDARGRDGELYTWKSIAVGEHGHGQLLSVYEFDPEDEDAAFAYAEERMQAASVRLAVTNRSVQSAEKLGQALNAHDIDAIMNCFSDDLVYDDHRRLTGDPISGRTEFRAAFERILAQYSHFERRVLAVRGDRLNLHKGRWSDDSGNETAYLHVYEMDDNGLQIYEGRFDEDDFEGAYRELQRRYCAGEGASFAAGVGVGTEWLIAANNGDFDRVFGELSHPDLRTGNRSRSGFPDRTAAELRASFDGLNAMVASARIWNSVEHWLSPAVVVGRQEREAVGPDGEQYTWVRLFVFEAADGRAAGMCEFDPDDEDAAFAYAEERVRVAQQR
uniref:YybH family protein n=1 Tax=Mycobacterium neglectum TaxID=242737 RepID=UPI001C3F3BD5